MVRSCGNDHHQKYQKKLFGVRVKTEHSSKLPMFAALTRQQANTVDILKLAIFLYILSNKHTQRPKPTLGSKK